MLADTCRIRRSGRGPDHSSREPSPQSASSLTLHSSYSGTMLSALIAGLEENSLYTLVKDKWMPLIGYADHGFSLSQDTFTFPGIIANQPKIVFTSTIRKTAMHVPKLCTGTKIKAVASCFHCSREAWAPLRSHGEEEQNGPALWDNFQPDQKDSALLWSTSWHIINAVVHSQRQSFSIFFTWQSFIQCQNVFIAAITFIVKIRRKTYWHYVAVTDVCAFQEPDQEYLTLKGKRVRVLGSNIFFASFTVMQFLKTHKSQFAFHDLFRNYSPAVEKGLKKMLISCLYGPYS